MAKILAQSKVFIDQQEIKNLQNEQKAKKMQETSAALQKAAVPAFSSDSETESKSGNGTENCDVQVETVAADARSGESGEQAAAESTNKTKNSNCSIRKCENSGKWAFIK